MKADTHPTHNHAWRNILRDPSRHFTRPQDIVESHHLSRAAKIDLLSAWERQVRHLQISTGENLVGYAGQTNRLIDEIHEGLDRLCRAMVG